MVKKYLSLFIFLFTTPSAADFTMNIENFEQFNEVTVVSAKELNKNKHIPKGESREDNLDYIYPDFYYSQDAENIYQWKSDGYTILKDDPSNDHEVKKIERIQRDLQIAFGEEFQEKFDELNSTYKLIDIRYYAINGNSSRACISVRWVARFLNDTVNFCGNHKVTADSLYFEIDEWSLNSGSGFNYAAFGKGDAWQLLEFTQAALSIVYSIQENQRELLKALNKPFLLMQDQ